MDFVHLKSKTDKKLCAIKILHCIFFIAQSEYQNLGLYSFVFNATLNVY